MSRRGPPQPDPREREIARLRDELYEARQAVIELAPAPFHEVLRATLYCRTIDDLLDWQQWCVGEVIDRADVKPGPEMGDFPGTVRAYCPLCGDGSASPFTKGFSVPVGLSRHLVGSHRVRSCSVMKAAFSQQRGLLPKAPPDANATVAVPPWKRPNAPPAKNASQAGHDGGGAQVIVLKRE